MLVTFDVSFSPYGIHGLSYDSFSQVGAFAILIIDQKLCRLYHLGLTIGVKAFERIERLRMRRTSGTVNLFCKPSPSIRLAIPLGTVPVAPLRKLPRVKSR